MDRWSDSCDGGPPEKFVDRGGEFFAFTGKERDAIEADGSNHEDQGSFRDERIDAGLELRFHENSPKDNDRDDRQAGEPGREDDRAGQFPAAEIRFARGPWPEGEPAEEEGRDEGTDRNADDVLKVGQEGHA